MSRVWMNGRLVRASSNLLSLQERGFLLGDGVFETIRFQDGAPRRWWSHLERLQTGLDLLGISPLVEDALLEASQQTAEANGLRDGIIRLTVSRGPGGRGMSPADEIDPTVIIAVTPMPERAESLTLGYVDFPRRNPMSLSARCKPLGYGDNLVARQTAIKDGADMAILQSINGDIACGDSANLFWISDDIIYTPALTTGAMAGITRDTILKSAPGTALMIEEVCAKANSLSEAEAVCVTNSVFGVVPVSRIGARRYQTDHPLLKALISLEEQA